ncbi:MAG: phosphohydrolase, partial [Sphaerochaetaceae bacterium]
KVGDIHKYSSNSIENVSISKGDAVPILIDVSMSSDVGFFQVEEVLLPKISMSPAKAYVQVHAGVIGKERKKYL